MTKSKQAKIRWYFDELRKDGPASAEFGPLRLSVSKIDDATGQWMLQGSLMIAATEELRGGIWGIAESREEGMKRATEAAINFPCRRRQAVND